MLVIFVVRAYALNPVQVPQAIQDEAVGSITVHKGTCDLKGVDTLCMVGYKEATDTLYILYFNQEGVLFQVDKHKDNKETTLWVHPHTSI